MKDSPKRWVKQFFFPRLLAKSPAQDIHCIAILLLHNDRQSSSELRLIIG